MIVLPLEICIYNIAEYLEFYSDGQVIFAITSRNKKYGYDR